MANGIGRIVMEALKLECYTIDDIYALPEGERAELIDGQIYYMASPTTVHQELISELLTIINNHIKAKKGGCKVYPPGLGVFLKKDDLTYLEPDLTVVCDPQKTASKKGCIGAPDWIIEITSPSTATRDYLKKFNLYKAAEVREYWIIDPDAKSVAVYNFACGEYAPEEYGFTDKIKVNIFEDLIIDFGELDIG